MSDKGRSEQARVSARHAGMLQRGCLIGLALPAGCRPPAPPSRQRVHRLTLCPHLCRVRASFEHAKTETIEKAAGDADGSVGHRAASVGNNEGPGAMGKAGEDHARGGDPPPFSTVADAKIRIIGAAAGSIIAAIITAHTPMNTAAPANDQAGGRHAAHGHAFHALQARSPAQGTADGRAPCCEALIDRQHPGAARQHD